MNKLKRIIFTLAFLFLASPAWATKYWGSTSGSDANACSAIDGDADPGTYRQTIAGVVACLSAGDTAFFKNGTYTPGATTTNPLPSGVSSVQPTILEGESRTGFIIQPTAGGGVISLTSARSNITFKKFTLDAVNLRSGETHGFRISNDIVFTGVILEDFTIKNPQGPGLVVGDEVTGLHAKRCLIKDGVGSQTQSPHGTYFRGKNSILEWCEISGWRQNGINNFSSPKDASGNIFRHNWIHDNGFGTETDGSGAGTNDRGIFIAGESNNLVYGNIVEGNSDNGIVVRGAGNKVYNNTVYGNGNRGIWIEATASSTTVTNNLSLGNTGSNYQDDDNSTTSTTNRTTGTATDFMTDPANGDFSLKAGSAAINAGTAISGFSYNGSAPDQGAFETMPNPTCTVEDGDASTVRVTFTNNVYPPIQTGAVTGITVLVAGGARTESSPTVVGTNRIDYTIDGAAVANGETVTWAAGSTNTVTDSAEKGDSLNQPLLATGAITCTNNVGESLTHVWRQVRFRFHKLDGVEASRKPACAENTNCTVQKGGVIGLRIKMVGETANPPSDGFELRYSKNSGAYALVPDSFTSDNIQFYGTSNTASDIPAQGTATTRLLTQDYATFVAGAVTRTSNAVPSVDLGTSEETELEWIVELDGDAAVGDTYDFRIYRQDGSALNTYTTTPRLTIAYSSGSVH